MTGHAALIFILLSNYLLPVADRRSGGGGRNPESSLFIITRLRLYAPWSRRFRTEKSKTTASQRPQPLGKTQESQSTFMFTMSLLYP